MNTLFMLLFGYSTFFDIFAVEYAIIYTITVFNINRKSIITAIILAITTLTTARANRGKFDA